MASDSDTNARSCQEHAFDIRAIDRECRAIFGGAAALLGNLRRADTLDRMAEDKIDVRRLRSALEFAMLMAKEGQKVRPPIDSPPALAKFSTGGRLPRSVLPAVRRIVESDVEFRELLAERATVDLVDDIGLLWLRRPDGWESAIRDAIADADEVAENASRASQLKQAERRRSAAERAAARATAELAARDERIADLETERAFLADEVVARDELVAATRSELATLKVEARHARDREQAARDRVESLVAELEQAQLEQAQLEQTVAALRSHGDSPEGSLAADRDASGAICDTAPATADGSEQTNVVDVDELASVAAAATELAARLVSLSGVADGDSEPDRADDSDGVAKTKPGTRARRRPLPMPGGVMGSSDRATRFLLESGGTVIIDGYNVAKLAWPDLALDQQRERLIVASENIVRRWGTEITIAFDGAGIAGAHTTRRNTVRVVYSDADQIADDWIRDEVRRLPVSRAVTVVTNDREVQRDVRSMGANVLSSDQLVAAFA